LTKPFKKTGFYLLSILLIVALVLAGCSSNNSGVNQSSTGSSSGGQSLGGGSQSEGGSSNEEDGPQKGGTLRIGMTFPNLNLGYTAGFRNFQDIFASTPALETLIRINESGEWEPFLADNWEVNPDNKTIVFKLKQGIQFHDGAVFNAAAVKANVDQAIEAKQIELSDIVSAEVVDEYTVRLRLANWNSAILDALANYLWIVSPDAIRDLGKEGLEKQPVGTGPFEFVSWEPDVALRYQKFEGYWQEGKPHLDAVEIRYYQDSMTASSSFKANEIDVFFYVPDQLANEMQGTAQIAQLSSGFGAGQEGLIASFKDPSSPFADVRVRKAMGHAIDVEAMIQSIKLGYAIPTNQWGPPAAWSYNPNLKGLPYDPELSKQLLAEAGYPDGFRTTLYATPNEQMLMTAVQGFLANVGIMAEIEMVDSGKMQQITSDGTWDGIVRLSLRGGEPELSLYMTRYFTEKAPRFAKGIVLPEELEPLFDELRLAKDQAEKEKIAHEIQRVVWEEHVLAIPLWVVTMPSILQNNVHGSGINKLNGSIWTPENAWLEQ